MEHTSRRQRKGEVPAHPGALQAHGEPNATRLAGMCQGQSLRVAFAAPLCGGHPRTPPGLSRPCAPQRRRGKRILNFGPRFGPRDVEKIMFEATWPSRSVVGL